MSRFLLACVFLALGLLRAQAQAENGGDLIHRVKAGDTLISIAHAYGVTLDQLLSLNGIDREALLQIGQRLLVISAGELAGDEGEAASEDAGGSETANAPAVVVAAQRWPPAPVRDADAPMRDPADLSARLCAAVYQDENQNGLMEPDEKLLPDATILLLEAGGALRSEYKTDGNGQPYCPDELERQFYTLEAIAPPGFGLTSAASLRVDLRAGGLARVDFGAKLGLEAPALAPPDEAPAPEPSEARAGRSPLRELGGLFVLGLAGVVLFSGLAVSLVVRGR
ncbi:MAG: LysM peptidoglycan-binding domain-containing protein [Chloroflexi bacterium]|nr:LysM peptidoglycan-binding domain-containing protein [Chloroflexota bacterium]